MRSSGSPPRSRSVSASGSSPGSSRPVSWPSPTTISWSSPSPWSSPTARTWSRTSRPVGIIATVVGPRLGTYGRCHCCAASASRCGWTTCWRSDGQRSYGVPRDAAADRRCGRVGRRSQMGLKPAHFIDMPWRRPAWEFVAFMLTAMVVFLLIGLAISVGTSSIRSARSRSASSASSSAARSSCTSSSVRGSRIVRAAGRGSAVPSAWLHVLFCGRPARRDRRRPGAVTARRSSRSAPISRRSSSASHLFTLLVQGATTGCCCAASAWSRRAGRALGGGLVDAPAAPEQAATFGRRGVHGRAGPPQDHVHLVAIRPADRHPIQPLDVLDVGARDLAERPARVPTEVEHAAGRVARRWSGRPEPLGGRIEASYPPPWLERPDDQSRETSSGGGGVAGRGAPVGWSRRSGRAGSVRAGSRPAARPRRHARDPDGRSRSKAARLAGSPSRSQAALIAAIRAAASGPGARSGWYFRARRR